MGVTGLRQVVWVVSDVRDKRMTNAGPAGGVAVRRDAASGLSSCHGSPLRRNQPHAGRFPFHSESHLACPLYREPTDPLAESSLQECLMS